MKRQTPYLNYSSSCLQYRTVRRRLLNVSLQATNNLYEDFEKWSPSSQFYPEDVEMIIEKNKTAREMVLSALKLGVVVSSSNIITNADYLISYLKNGS